MNWLSGIAFIAGAVVPIQAALNASLKTHLPSAMQAALASFTVGTVAILIYCFAVRTPLPSASTLAQVPWWGWLGGLLGGFFIWSTIVTGPKLGAVAMLALVVAGQMTASLLLDHFGLLGLPQNAVSWERILGVGLVIAGVSVTLLSTK